MDQATRGAREQRQVLLGERCFRGGAEQMATEDGEVTGIDHGLLAWAIEEHRGVAQDVLVEHVVASDEHHERLTAGATPGAGRRAARWT